MHKNRKKKLVNQVSRCIKTKFESFKKDQEQKYNAVKTYFASDEEMDKEVFTTKEKFFFLEMLKLILYLSIFVIMYLVLCR